MKEQEKENCLEKEVDLEKEDGLEKDEDLDKDEDLEKDEGLGKEIESENLEDEKEEEIKEMTEYEKRLHVIKIKEMRKEELKKIREARCIVRPGQRRPVAIIEWLENEEEATCTAICAVNEHEVHKSINNKGFNQRDGRNFKT